MTNRQIQLTEAFDKFNGSLNDRLRFFICSAVKDALVLGNRSHLLKVSEAETLLDVMENFLTEARKADEVRKFLADSSEQPQQQTGDNDGDMTPKKYYEIFIKPALDIICEEYSEIIGSVFVKYICTGERPADDALKEDEKLLWNVFMVKAELMFNDSFSYYSEAFAEYGE